jgi:hypothetical protein
MGELVQSHLTAKAHMASPSQSQSLAFFKIISIVFFSQSLGLGSHQWCYNKSIGPLTLLWTFNSTCHYKTLTKLELLGVMCIIEKVLTFVF